MPIFHLICRDCGTVMGTVEAERPDVRLNRNVCASCVRAAADRPAPAPPEPPKEGE